jgi:hypothetical protein
MNHTQPFQLNEAQSGVDRGDMPRMLKVRQEFPRPVEADLAVAVRRELAPMLPRVRPGQSIAITGSSRGIANLAAVIAESVKALKEAGAQPFVFPAMGSHGGATAEGQIGVLHNAGISEAAIGCPIRSSMDVIQVGTTATGFPVYQDRQASEADGVLAINRVKPHTGFTEVVESGLCKMLVIGMGKQAGAQKIHQQALKVDLGRMVLDASRIILESTAMNFIGGLALVENAFKETAAVKGIAMEEHGHLVEEEAKLLKKAYEWLPRIPFDEVDTLIIDRIGKNISGSGMDTNVVGKKPGLTEPQIGAIYVRGLTPETHGNATGIGMADVILRPLMDEIDLHSTYMNAFTAKRLLGAKMPLLAESELQAMQVCLTVRAEEDLGTAKVVWIENTNKLFEFWVSEFLLEAVEKNPRLKALSAPLPVLFDDQDALVKPQAA